MTNKTIEFFLKKLEMQQDLVNTDRVGSILIKENSGILMPNGLTPHKILV